MWLGSWRASLTAGATTTSSLVLPSTATGSYTTTLRRSIVRCAWYCCFLSSSLRAFPIRPTANTAWQHFRRAYQTPGDNLPHRRTYSWGFTRPEVFLAMSPPLEDGDDAKTTASSPERRRSSPRKSVKPAATTTTDEETEPAMDKVKGSKKKLPVAVASSPRKRKTKVTTDETEKVMEKKPKAKKAAAPKKKRASSVGDNAAAPSPPKKKKAPAHQVLTERDSIPKLWEAADHKSSYTFKIGSWNVAGLRAVMKKDPESIGKLIERLNLDVLCLQEIKLQELHLDDPKVTLPEVDGYEAHYSCSTAKKGYSGTAVFIRKRGAAKKKAKQTSMDAFVKAKPEVTVPASHKLPVDAKVLTPDAVSMKMGVDKHDQEGRINVVDFPLFTFCNVYVPNAGQNLERLDYRTKEWDKDFLAFMQSKQKDRGVPVLWLGDLNVAHTNLEVWNDGAKHLAKQAGVTVQERASFQAQLDAGFVDAFRRLHPDAQGHYSYWSMRAGNRAPNKGLRLDYFICDSQFFDEETSRVIVRDSYVVEDHVGSDHCPVVLEIEIKGE